MPLPIYIKKTIIEKLISCAKIVSSSKTIFYKELMNIKEILINNGLPYNIVDVKIKRTIRNVSLQDKHGHTSTNKSIYEILFYSNQMHYNY